MLLTRRTFTVHLRNLLAWTALAPLLPPLAALTSGGARAQQAPTPSAADLAQAGPLKEMALGPENAAVTIIEYASMTCSHCANFATTTFPKLKQAYIDTGKIRFILREFPLDPLAAAGFMLGRCTAKDDPEKYFAFVDMLFAQQKDWVTQKPLEPLMRLSKQAGLSEKEFETCLADQTLLDNLSKVRDRATQVIGVNSTPTFFINGQVQRGDIPFEDLEKLIKPMLKD